MLYLGKFPGSMPRTEIEAISPMANMSKHKRMFTRRKGNEMFEEIKPSLNELKLEKMNL